MEYSLEVSEKIDKIFLKLKKRDWKQLKIIDNKVREILKNPHHYKPLRGDMHGSRRAHIDSSFVLTYEIDDIRKVVRLLDYDHHDNIY